MRSTKSQDDSRFLYLVGLDLTGLLQEEGLAMSCVGVFPGTGEQFPSSIQEKGRDSFLKREGGDEGRGDVTKGFSERIAALQMQTEGVDARELSFSIHEAPLAGFLVLPHPAQCDVCLGQDGKERGQRDGVPIHPLEKPLHGAVCFLPGTLHLFG